ncbi:unnamed protein product [Arabis nemorensis]|uniref:Uncharacterized protein n=1 Tax=Arabis nemorensis TaxID=586526 RepID=A0A565CPB3_9BRAS|nr:unnamed protein product [Arabis nemorensis]
MGDINSVLTQLALVMEKLNNVGEDVKSLKETVSEHGATLETLTSERAPPNNKSIGKSPIKFATEELSEADVMSEIKENKGLNPRGSGEVSSLKGDKAIHTTSGRMFRDEPTSAFTGGPWPSRAVGSERGHRRVDGGGDWQVRAIGTAVDETLQNYSCNARVGFWVLRRSTQVICVDRRKLKSNRQVRFLIAWFGVRFREP